MQLTPSTTDLATAQAWFGDYRAAGIEGLVVKGAASVYAPGKRSWVKVKSRESTEVIVGAVTGTLTRPQTIVAGRFRDGAPFRPWLLRIVANQTRNEVRSRTRRDARALRALELPAPADPSLGAEVHERDRALLAAVRTLTGRKAVAA